MQKDTDSTHSVMPPWGFALPVFIFLFGASIPTTYDDLRGWAVDRDMNYLPELSLYERWLLFVSFALLSLLIYAAFQHIADRKIMRRMTAVPENIKGSLEINMARSKGERIVGDLRLHIQSMADEIMKGCLVKVVRFENEAKKPLYRNLPMALCTVNRLKAIQKGESSESGRFDLRPEEPKRMEFIEVVSEDGKVFVSTKFEQLAEQKMVEITEDHFVCVGFYPTIGKPTTKFYRIEFKDGKWGFGLEKADT